MNFYQHHIGDFNNATRHLTRIERSIYRDLIELYYDKEAPIPTDVQRALKLVAAHTDEEKAAVHYILDEFFELRDDGWHQHRCDLELERFYAKSEQARSAGIASAERRANRKSTEKQRALNGGSTDGQPPMTHDPLPMTKMPADAAPDPLKQIFDIGVSLLTAHGSSESSARSFLGKLAKADQAGLLAALGHLAANPKIDPKAYLIKCLPDVTDPILGNLRKSYSDVRKVGSGYYSPSANRNWDREGKQQVSL